MFGGHFTNRVGTVGVPCNRVLLYFMQAFFRRLIVALTSLWATVQLGFYEL